MKLLKKGLTLVEVLLTVSIVGIIAGIAIPQYNSYQEKSYVQAAQVVLQSIRSDQKLFFLQQDRFATSFAELDVTPPGLNNPFTYTMVNTPDGMVLVATRNQGNYSGETITLPIARREDFSYSPRYHSFLGIQQ